MDNGKPFRESKDADVEIMVRHFYHHAGWAQLMDTEMQGWKPVGKATFTHCIQFKFGVLKISLYSPARGYLR